MPCEEFGGELGFCRRFPPEVGHVLGKMGFNSDMWAMTNDDDWCGEFKPKADAGEDASAVGMTFPEAMKFSYETGEYVRTIDLSICVICREDRQLYLASPYGPINDFGLYYPTLSAILATNWEVVRYVRPKTSEG